LKSDACAHLRAGNNRRGKPNPVQAVVDSQGDTASDPDRIAQELAEKRQGEKPMCDRGAIGRLALGALGIHMYPLSVFSGFSELLDAFLRDGKPFRRDDLLTHEAFQHIKVVNFKARHLESDQQSSGDIAEALGGQYVVQSALKLWDDGKEIAVSTGEVLSIAPSMPQRSDALEDALDLDIFDPPRAEFINMADTLPKR
jgi:hypothetical protein